MDELNYCRVCLVTDVKMFTLETTSSDSIGVVYSHLVQIPVFDRNQHVCFECANLLHKYQEFKSKCLRAHNILSRIKITRKTIKAVDRKQNKLESSLSLGPMAVSYEEPSNETDEANTDSKEGIKLKEDNKNKQEEILLHNIDPNEESEFDDTLNTFNEGDLIEFSEENLPIYDLRSTQKSILNKDQETKKRKLKAIIKSEDDISDDEPLSKSVSKTTGIKKTIERRKKDYLDDDYFDDYATVEFLTPEDARKEMLLRKESNNYKKSPFKCDLCYRGFEAAQAFKNHMKKHSVENGEYECELCHLRFPQHTKLCKHRLASHRRKFSCKLCPYICFCSYQAKNHVRFHKGKKYPCECGQIFSMPNSLLMHKHKKHLPEAGRECVCAHCGSSFGTPKGLYQHYMKLHRQDKNDKLGPKCEDCGVQFTSEVALKRHLVVSSKHVVSNGCKYCGERFADIVELKSHMRVFHSRKHVGTYNTIKLPKACTICDKWLTNRVEYKNHMTSEHPHTDEAKKFTDEDPFVCEVCGKMFKQQCLLTYHQRKHTGERPYKCQDCGKTFQMAGTLSIHRSIHNSKRTHKCDMCARAFTFKSTLNKHMKAHLGIRPHKCAMCDKSFIHMCDLKLHIRCAHDKVPWPKKKNKRTKEDPSYLDYN